MVMEDMQILEEPTELSLDTHKAIGFTALLSILDNGCMLFKKKVMLKEALAYVQLFFYRKHFHRKETPTLTLLILPLNKSEHLWVSSFKIPCDKF